MRVRFCYLAGIVFVSAAVLANIGVASDYYVAPTGNDANSGTSPAQAWRTIQRAVNQPVAPGDSVFVADGTYVGWATSIGGSAIAPIRWIAAGSNVVVDQPYPSGPGNSNDNIRLMNANHNVIEGFQSINAPRAGIAVRGLPNQPILGVTVRNCSARDNQTWGIFDAFAEGVRYEGNTCSGSLDEHGIYHSNSGDDAVIRNNTCFGNRAAGLHMNGDLSQGGDGIISRALVENNVIYGNGVGGAGGINMDGVQDSLIQNNLLFDNHASGIIGYRIDGGGASKNNVIANNTVIMANDGRWALKIVDGSTGCVLLNNVLYRDHAFRGSIAIDAASLPGFVSDYNVVVNRFSIDGDATSISLAQWRAATGQDLHSILIDATTIAQFFVAPNLNDWHLKLGSPAADAGTASLAGHSAPPNDYEGESRPAGNGVDIGADEQCAAPVVYGTPKINSLGCTPQIGSSGVPSASAALPFLITATNVLSHKHGLLFYGAMPSSQPFQGGFKLVAPPTVRTPLQNSGGASAANDCSGTYSFDMNAHIQSAIDPNLVLGAQVYCQYWSRDPASPSTTGLTNALAFSICR